MVWLSGALSLPPWASGAQILETQQCKQKTGIHQSLKAGKSRSRSSVGDPLPGCRHNLQLCPHMCGELWTSQPLAFFLLRTLIPSTRSSPCDLITPRPLCLIPHIKFWGGRGAGYQCLAGARAGDSENCELGEHHAISPSAQASLCTEVTERRYLETFRD